MSHVCEAWVILVPRGRAPFGQHQELRPLAWPMAWPRWWPGGGGLGQRSPFLVLTKRSAASEDENELGCCTIAVMSYVGDMSSDVMWNTQPIISCILSNNMQLRTGN